MWRQLIDNFIRIWCLKYFPVLNDISHLKIQKQFPFTIFAVAMGYECKPISIQI